MQIHELEDAYWGFSTYSTAGIIENQPPNNAVCNYYSNGGGGYYKTWPEHGTKLFDAFRYEQRFLQDNNFTLPTASFIHIAEIGNEYWGMGWTDWKRGIENQPPYLAVGTYRSNGAGGFIKESPNEERLLWNWQVYAYRFIHEPPCQLEPATFIQIPELGNAYWKGTLENQPPFPAVATYRSDGEWGFYKEWSTHGTHLWGPAEYQYRLNS